MIRRRVFSKKDYNIIKIENHIRSRQKPVVPSDEFTGIFRDLI
jgi:hypothetical protein